MNLDNWKWKMNDNEVKISRRTFRIGDWHHLKKIHEGFVLLSSNVDVDTSVDCNKPPFETFKKRE